MPHEKLGSVSTLCKICSVVNHVPSLGVEWSKFCDKRFPRSVLSSPNNAVHLSIVVKCSKQKRNRGLVWAVVAVSNNLLKNAYGIAGLGVIRVVLVESGFVDCLHLYAYSS